MKWIKFILKIDDYFVSIPLQFLYSFLFLLRFSFCERKPRQKFPGMNESLKVRGRTPLLQPREKGLKTERPGLITSSRGCVSPSQSDRQRALFAFRSSPYLSLGSFSLLILRFFPFFAFPFFPLPFTFASLCFILTFSSWAFHSERVGE